ncbi:MAG TPA: hypothetical protein VFV71_00915 [Burkholderiales bacterium]|nr:hypothetical protein [Burkholderiales bacterium]
MAILELRNAYFRGWFAARARRRLPRPSLLEEVFFIGMGFSDGESSEGGPLEPWSRGIGPGVPANPGALVGANGPVFTTRRPDVAPQWRSPVPRQLPPASPGPPELTERTPDTQTEPGEEDEPAADRPTRLPEKKPSFSLPSRPAYGGGVKRRPARFAR